MSHRYKVLISAPYMQPVIERFRPMFEQANVEIVLPVVHERLEEAELLQLMSDIDGVIAGDDRFTAKVIENSPKLKVLPNGEQALIPSIKTLAKKQESPSATRPTPLANPLPIAFWAICWPSCAACIGWISK
jgi:phosphoglycerate dehydrogenase-like enzyme